MATISRTGITDGGTISSTHITNIIDALDGTGVGITVVATGSFSGSLVGNATTATTASYVANASSFPYTGSAVISGSLAVTGSTSLLGNVTISGSGVGINMYSSAWNGNLRASTGLIVDLSIMGKSAGNGKFTIPVNAPAGVPPAGTMYWDDTNATLFIYSEVNVGWASMTFTI